MCLGARAILRHGSQFADPKVSLKYWKFWHEFEVAHGNEDTFREMLRIKRTVSAQYENDVSFGFVKDDQVVNKPVSLEEKDVDVDEEKEDVVMDQTEEAEKIKRKVVHETQDTNLEIDLEQQSVPSTVFGDAITKAKEEAAEQRKLGALERFK